MENNILNLKSKVALNCSLCDKCCEYRGDIKITPINVLQISKYLKITLDEFIDNYTMESEEGLEIVIKGIGDKRVCVFNNRGNNKCLIQKVKPIQCVVFPLVPIDINKDLFINSNQCKIESPKKVTVNKWLNGNNKIYNKNKRAYLKWIEFVEEVQPKWNSVSDDKKNKLKNILFKEYNLKYNFEEQVLNNIKKARNYFLKGI